MTTELDAALGEIDRSFYKPGEVVYARGAIERVIADSRNAAALLRALRVAIEQRRRWCWASAASRAQECIRRDDYEILSAIRGEA